MTAYAMTSPIAIHCARTAPVRMVAPASTPARRPQAVRPESGRVRISAIQTPAARARRRGIVVVLLLVLGAFLAPQAIANAGDEVPPVLDSYTVSSGETLWSIAASITPEGVDVRDVVADIQTVNAMQGASLQAGQQLLLPEVG
ncbi:LysM peptidoglycan-binding domain-containing protein [Demequina sp. NBRC 110056]|uniref:LysM peptidoglycan-binding domain-containing protein n=1 Tax=Demequina sp. NBRC 110056 TaxID=1570345 RepID=UPI0013564F13|nr:LysM peptidoglycan-binding domain-containing protein [Demequina sp. NBRC 110056]